MPEMLPNLIIPGAQKSATTYLASLLARHRDIYLGEQKEPHYFSRDSRYREGPHVYRSLYSGHLDEPYTLDASTSYLPLPGIAERILDTLGRDVKFIVPLRNPVVRAVSGFLQLKLNERGDLRSEPEDMLPASLENMTLEDLLAFEKQKINEEARRGTIRLKPREWGWNEFPYNYFAVGCYSEQIRRFRSIFPRESFLFLPFEEVTGDRGVLEQKLSRFLGVDPDAFESQVKETLNESKETTSAYKILAWAYRKTAKKVLPDHLTSAMKSRALHALSRNSKAGFSPLAYERLIEIFSKEITNTSELTGLDLSAWLSGR